MIGDIKFSLVLGGNRSQDSTHQLTSASLIPTTLKNKKQELMVCPIKWKKPMGDTNKDIDFYLQKASYTHPSQKIKN